MKYLQFSRLYHLSQVCVVSIFIMLIGSSFIRVQAQKKPTMPPKVLRALNAYTQSINKINKRTNYIITWEQNIYNYIRLLKLTQKKIKDTPGYQLTKQDKTVINSQHLFLSQVLRRFAYNKKYIAGLAQANQNLPSAYQTKVHKALRQAIEVIKKKQNLGLELLAHVNDKAYKADNCATIVKSLHSYLPIYKELNNKFQKLKSILAEIRNQYTLPKNKASLQSFVSTLETSKTLIESIQKFLYSDGGRESFLDANAQAILHKLAKANIPQTQPQHAKVKQAAQKLQKSAQWVANAKGKYLVSVKALWSIINNYNSLVKTYNKVSEGSTPPVLQKTIYENVTIYDTLTHEYTPCDCKNNNVAVNMGSLEGYAPVNFMLLMDVSLSMKDYLPMLKDAFKYLVSIMRPEDKVSIVGFSLKASLILKPTSATQREVIFRAIDKVTIKTGTDGEAGLKMAYEWVQKNYKPEANNRIVMATDGEFKMSFDTYDLIGEKADKGITLSLFSFADQLKYYKQLKSMTRQGKGNYELVVPGDIAYKIVREVQTKKLPGQKVSTNTSRPCDCNQTKVQPPLKKRTSLTNNDPKVNMTSMQGFAHNNLMLLLDVSGSMADKNKLPLLKSSLKYLVSIMRPEDDVSIVIYAGDATVALEPTSASKQEQINAVINKLYSRGKTNIKAGFKLAYKWMRKNFKKKGNNRIILATDGSFPVSKYIYKLVEKQAKQNINLSVFSFGNNQKHENLQKLVEKGKGNYEHIDTNNARYKLIKEAQSKSLK